MTPEGGIGGFGGSILERFGPIAPETWALALQETAERCARCGVSPSEETLVAAAVLRAAPAETWTARGLAPGTVLAHLRALYEGREVGNVDGGRVRLGAPGVEWTDLAASPAGPDQVALLRAASPPPDGPANTESVPALLGRLRAAGVQVWLEPDGWSLGLRPRPLALRRDLFEAMTDRVDEVRAHLQVQAKRRAA